MGFLGGLKGGKVPSELPDLAIDSSKKKESAVEPKRVAENMAPKPIEPQREEIPAVFRPKPRPVPQQPQMPELPEKREEAPEQLVFKMPESLREAEIMDLKEEARRIEMPERKEEKIDIGELANESYFEGILEDINGEIQDLGNLEEWYNKKFLPQDVVSNMRGFWEGNKAEIIIKSFGSDYKKKINAKISKMSELEMDWREIYFKLVKKEEEMKKEERELKEILSEFVEICKLRGKPDGQSEDSKK